MSAVAVEWEVFQDALKEAEDTLEIFQAEAHGTRHAERSDAAKQSVKTAMQQAKAVDAAIMEVRSAEERAVWKRKILQGKKAVKSIETQAAQLDRLSAKKTKLFEGAPGEEEMEEGDPRARAENTARKLLGQNQSVQRSEMIALESERIGLGTVGTLRSNRDTMLRTIDRVCPPPPTQNVVFSSLFSLQPIKKFTPMMPHRLRS